MKILRAIGSGALLWVLIFFEVSILMFGFGLKSGMLNYYIIHYVALAILTMIMGLYYFKKDKPGWIKGLGVGITMLIVGVILDALITVLLFTKSFSFFGDVYLWVGYLEGVIIITLVGGLKK